MWLIYGADTRCECWESNPGPVQEQCVLSTTEPCLQANCQACLIESMMINIPAFDD
ncbi:rCG50068 [Rattus norvegicus]|uniref:RCG50068 n=1 Tax=Rattus norvegicus TaxID=10116 RepID=A6JV57_RAT|nr:rCG50068 [Rattus norvegicus]